MAGRWLAAGPGFVSGGCGGPPLWLRHLSPRSDVVGHALDALPAVTGRAGVPGAEG